MFTNRALALLLALLAAGAGLAFTWGGTPAVEQPLAFNHKRHIAEDMACKDCHQKVEDGPHATFPSVKACLLCHKEAKGQHPDEPKIRAYAEAGKEIPWIQVNRLPGHVYFSHVAHVNYAQMDCAVCHGDMKERSKPVTVPQIGHLDMDRCMDCHREKGVSLDCLRCHK